MSATPKLIIALEDPSPTARAGFTEWARAEARAQAIQRAEIETLAPDAHAAHTAKPPRYFGFASFWSTEKSLDGLRRRAPAPSAWFLVQERMAFDRSARPDEARPWAGIKKTTPWSPIDGVDTAIWQARYTNHGEIARAYHATCVRYRQNIVLAANVPEIGAVSELWWTDVEDLVERFYLSRDAERLLAVDTMGFVDTARAHPVVTAHETLRSGGITPTRGFLPDQRG
jgi:hypothetical protein